MNNLESDALMQVALFQMSEFNRGPITYRCFCEESGNTNQRLINWLYFLMGVFLIIFCVYT